MSKSTGLVFHGIGHKTGLNAGAPGLDIVDSSVSKIILAETDISKEQLVSGRWVNSYNGTTSYHETNQIGFLQSCVQGTILIWVKAEWSSMTYTDIRIVSSAHTAGANSEFRTYNNEDVEFIMGYGADKERVRAFPDGDASDFDNQWVFIHYKWYESGGSYYLQGGHNGVWLHTSFAVPNAFVMPDTSFDIGKWGANYMAGYIDPEIKIYSHALNAGQIASEYNNKCRDFGLEPIS